MSVKHGTMTKDSVDKATGTTIAIEGHTIPSRDVPAFRKSARKQSDRVNAKHKPTTAHVATTAENAPYKTPKSGGKS
jgi:hypothetical protein